MNINQLYAFKAVYDTGSFSSAARSLNITQSAITQLIQGLEKHMNTQLFIRLKRPITPTDNGVLYYEYAKKIIELHEEVTRLIEEKDKGFTLSYRFTSAGILDKFLMSNPAERPKEIENISQEDFNSVSAWKIRYLYFVRGNVINSKNVYYTPVHISKVYAAVNSNSPLAKKEYITAHDLCNETVILPKLTTRTIVAQKLSQIFSEFPEIKIKEVEGNFDASLRYVSLFNYVAFCTEEFTKEYDQIQYIEFKSELAFEYGFACIGEPTKEMKNLIKSFKNWALHQNFWVK